MRILYISHDGDNNGGAGLALLDLLESLKEYKDVEPVVLVPNNKAGLTEILEKRNIPYIIYPYYLWTFVKSKFFLKNLLKYARVIYWQVLSVIFIKKLIKQIKYYNIDIIHSNSSVINIGGWINKFTKIPHIWHVREFGEEHHKFKFMLGSRFARKFMEKYSSKVVTISDALNNKYLQYIKKDKLIRIYDGLPCRYDNPKDNRRNKSYKFCVLITGAIQRGKGQIQAVKAIKNLIKSGISIELILAGRCYDKRYFNEIKKIIDKNGISDYIKFIGQCNDMNKIRRNIDIEIICSEMEGFGRVTIEGMLSMLPIVASKSGANTELIKNGVNGFLYELGNVKDLEEKIFKLYNDKKLRQIMGLNGYKIAKQNFTQEINTNKIYKLYKEVLKNNL